MDISIHSSFLPHTDPDASLAFFRDTLGFEVRGDVGYEGMRWITVGPADQPDTAIVLHPPAATPGITDDERRTISELMAKGSYFGVNLASKDLDGTFAQLEASGAEIVQEPTDQPDTAIVLHPPAATPGITDDERRTISEMMAKGTYAGIVLATKDLDASFERLQANGAEIVQEPTDQPYGVSDCAVRDPAGNLLRIQEHR